MAGRDRGHILEFIEECRCGVDPGGFGFDDLELVIDEHIKILVE